MTGQAVGLNPADPAKTQAVQITILQAPPPKLTTLQTVITGVAEVLSAALKFIPIP